MKNEITVEGLPSHAEEALTVLQHLVALRIRIVGRSQAEVYQKFVSEFPPPMKAQVATVQKAIEKIDIELWNAARAVAEASGQRFDRHRCDTLLGDLVQCRLGPVLRAQARRAFGAGEGVGHGRHFGVCATVESPGREESRDKDCPTPAFRAALSGRVGICLTNLTNE